METTNKSIGNFNELLFENKHKEYGAYAIRKSYTDNVTRALFITSLFFGLLALTLATLNKGEDKIPDTSGNIPPIDSLLVYTIDITPPEKLKAEVIKEKIVEEVKTKSDDINYKVADKIVETAAAINDQAVVTSKGDEKGDSSEFFKEIPDVLRIRKTETGDINPLISVTEPPEFYGNLQQFIRDNLRFPQMAKDNGTTGTLGVSFVIEKDGSVSNIKNLNTIGDVCTEEAIRVLKLMPK